MKFPKQHMKGFRTYTRLNENVFFGKVNREPVALYCDDVSKETHFNLKRHLIDFKPTFMEGSHSDALIRGVPEKNLYSNSGIRFFFITDHELDRKYMLVWKAGILHNEMAAALDNIKNTLAIPKENYLSVYSHNGMGKTIWLIAGLFDFFDDNLSSASDIWGIGKHIQQEHGIELKELLGLSNVGWSSLAATNSWMAG